ncbi:GDYXXLXY domain-containing protein [Sulfurospirillum sp.]|uniref:GDYXXLXY domain-containing protein n=1 Tax=Sulfurospirillum sp. TaxID=2053622 RepID=UPI002FDC885E
MKTIKLFSWIFFGLLCLVQLGVILFQITSYERILKEGEVFYFKVVPLDPYDAFRGRYVSLRFENASKVPLVGDNVDNEASKGYAILEHKDSRDIVKEVQLNKPSSGNFIEVAINYINHEKDNHISANISLPFDRFYMREEIAPKAEKVLRARSGVSVNAKLRVLNGKGVIEELMVGETPLSQFVLSH